jgi:hypothetical protein
MSRRDLFVPVERRQCSHSRLTGQGTINDNDPAHRFQLTTSASQGDSGITIATFTVCFRRPAPDCNCQLCDGGHTATAGSDYQSTGGSLTFNPARRQRRRGNDQWRYDVRGQRTFFVNLKQRQNASISDNQGNGTITNDDPSPPVQPFNQRRQHCRRQRRNFCRHLQRLAVTSERDSRYSGLRQRRQDRHNRFRLSVSQRHVDFAIGETSKTISVDIPETHSSSTTKHSLVNLTNATGGAIIGDNQGRHNSKRRRRADLVISQVYPGGGLSGATFTKTSLRFSIAAQRRSTFRSRLTQCSSSSDRSDLGGKLI